MCPGPQFPYLSHCRHCSKGLHVVTYLILPITLRKVWEHVYFTFEETKAQRVGNLTRPQNWPVKELGYGNHILATFWLRAQVLFKSFITIVWTKSFISVINILQHPYLSFQSNSTIVLLTHKQALVNGFQHS